MKRISIRNIKKYERYSNGFFQLYGETTDSNGNTRTIRIKGQNGPKLPEYKINGQSVKAFRTYNGAKAEHHPINSDRESMRIYAEEQTIKTTANGEVHIENPQAVQILPPYGVNDAPQRIGKTTGRPTKAAETEYALIQRAQLCFIFGYCKCDNPAALADRLYKKATKGEKIGVDPIIDEQGNPDYTRPWYKLIMDNLPEIMDENRENPLNVDLIKIGNREWSTWQTSWMRAILWTNYLLEHPLSQDSYIPMVDFVKILKVRLNSAARRLETYGIYMEENEYDEKTLIMQLKDSESAHKRFTIVTDKEGDYICLRKVRKAEKEAAELLSHFSAAKTGEAEIVESLPLSEEQRAAVEGIVSIYRNGGGIVILTGGPGTGKTTVLKSVLDTLKMYGETNVLLCSPTGMAAKRMTDATGKEASTIHRALEVDPEQGLEKFKRNKENPLEGKVFIIDEVSMIDIVLLRDFLLAVPEGATILFVGDPDQLPSVGPGQVLRELLQTNSKIAKFSLTRNYRSGESLIAKNAKKIISGDPDLEYREGEFIRWDLIGDNPLPLIKSVCNTARIDIMSDNCQILTYKNSDSFSINRQIVKMEIERLYKRHNSPQEVPVISYDGMKFFEGEKVILTRNNYQHKNAESLKEAKKEQGEDAPYFNGEKGEISEVDYYNCSVTVQLPDKELILYGEDLKDLQPAYAITTHKAQGSEYGAVIVYLNNKQCPADRQWLYTAVTRSKEQVILINRGTSYKEEESAISCYINTPPRQRRSHFLRELTENGLTGERKAGKITFPKIRLTEEQKKYRIRDPEEWPKWMHQEYFHITPGSRLPHWITNAFCEWFEANKNSYENIRPDGGLYNIKLITDFYSFQFEDITEKEPNERDNNLITFCLRTGPQLQKLAGNILNDRKPAKKPIRTEENDDLPWKMAV